MPAEQDVLVELKKHRDELTKVVAEMEARRGAAILTEEALVIAKEISATLAKINGAA